VAATGLSEAEARANVVRATQGQDASPTLQALLAHAAEAQERNLATEGGSEVLMDNIAEARETVKCLVPPRLSA
jgi:hypothetical protein